MDAATIQSRIYAGRGKVAQYIGLSCNVFRPLTAAAPLANQVATLNVALNAANPNYTRPNLYGKAVWFADMDGRTTQPGDYLVRVSDSATWFVAGQQQLLPIVVIECNGSIRVEREPAQTSVGQVGYGSTSGAVNVLGTNGALWPASILQGGKPVPSVGLPSSVKEAGWKILLPPSVPITILAADLIKDDTGRGFTVASAELTDLGWRLEANESHT